MYFDDQNVTFMNRFCFKIITQSRKVYQSDKPWEGGYVFATLFPSGLFSVLLPHNHHLNYLLVNLEIGLELSQDIFYPYPASQSKKRNEIL